jgi:indolepyruvate ferredoxin oxidoreductase beta subunit
MSEPRPITIAILAMGGEGGGVLADWITDLGEHTGFYAQTTSVPGVAQRTGSTIYYVELFPETGGSDPVLALMPVPGELDLVIASELMEAGRAVQRGLVTPDRTSLVTSTHRVYSMIEKTALADGRVDDSKIIEACASAAKKLVRADFARIAEDTRSVISAALFGAVAGTGALPFARAQFEEAIRRGGVGVDSSLAAFAAGFKAASESEAPADETVPELGTGLTELASRIQKDFPARSHAVLFAGVQRLADYQDESYAAEYLVRLEPIRDLDRDGRLLQETARYLALWMSYEDTIRIADLKTRRSRFERVRRESRADAGQIIHIREFLHPRVEEISDTMPAGIGRWLRHNRWARGIVDQFTRKGKMVETTAIGGFLMLYLIANLRPFRRRSLRFGIEQARIEEWLAGVKAAAGRNYELAVEMAECPRMVKGYGDTYRRGWANFETLMTTVQTLWDEPDAASYLKRLRDAALADETGAKLAEALQEVTA